MTSSKITAKQRAVLTDVLRALGRQGGLASAAALTPAERQPACLAGSGHALVPSAEGGGEMTDDKKAPAKKARARRGRGLPEEGLEKSGRYPNARLQDLDDTIF